MTDGVADMEQRLRAIEPESSFIVQAPAGSGKTELLIQRYLRLLAVVDAPEEIVAITFTRKAATEMRGRIINALEGAADAGAASDEAACTTPALARQAMDRNRALGWELEHSPGRLRIQTIDALCGALTRQMPVLSRFGAQPEIVEQAGELYLQAAADTLAELEGGHGWSDAIAVLLAHLDNDLPKVRDMLAGMLARRDQWLRHVAGGIRREELEGALKHMVEGSLEAAARGFPQELAGELAAVLDYAAANLDGADADSPIRACAGLKDLPPAVADHLEQWRGVTTLLLTEKGDWRRAVDARNGFPPAGGNQPGRVEDRAAMKNRFKAMISRLSEDDDLLGRLQEVRNLPRPWYTGPEWQVVQALCELLKLADAQLRLLFAERNQVDFSAVTQAAIQALGGEESPTDLALNLDYRIRHILVDEYQDISINQYTLLQRLTAGWSPQDGHSLFLVGDPMQSIYRFREAEVGLFLNTWEQRRLGQVALSPLTLRVNFRSGPDLIGWVNEVFTRVLPPAADVGRGAVHYTPAEAWHAQTGARAVTLHPLLDADEEREARVVLQQILAAREADPQGRIAVLVRGRNHLRGIVPQLQRAGLRYRAVDIDPLGEQPAVQDLMALTRALLHFADRVAWLALLRAPWCGLRLADLLVIAGSDHGRRTVWECLCDEARIRALSEDGRARALRLREILDTALQGRHGLSLSRWVEAVWLRLGGPATLPNETELENARGFFRLLDQFEQGGDLRDREAFMEQVAGLYAAPDIHADERLQIMTIHKAKGLEFDTVILPGLARGSRGDDTRLLLWSENPHRDHQDLLLAPVKEAGEREAPLYRFLKRLDGEKQSFEDGRLLYVAATRARKCLHLIGSMQTVSRNGVPDLSRPRSDSLLAQLWPLVEPEFRAALEHHAAETGGEGGREASRGAILRRLIRDWQRPAPPPAVVWRTPVVEVAEQETPAVEYEWAGETIRHIGSVVHRGIQWIAEDGVVNWDEDRIRSKRGYYRQALQRLGVPDGNAELENAVDTVESALINLVNDDRGRWLLDSGHTDAHNEFAVSGIHKQQLVNVIIDRTFIDADGVRWIVDYKTSRHKGGSMDVFLDREQERYREQLEKYACIVRKMDKRPVKLGLYFPLLRGWREWSFDERHAS